MTDAALMFVVIAVVVIALAVDLAVALDWLWRRWNKPERKLSNLTSPECQTRWRHWRKNAHDYRES